MLVFLYLSFFLINLDVAKPQNIWYPWNGWDDARGLTMWGMKIHDDDDDDRWRVEVKAGLWSLCSFSYKAALEPEPRD